MSSVEPVVAAPGRGVAHSAPQRRIIAAALDLFARHGVSGTSLQMIADAVGVTKAAVYHQFRTKDEIVLAAAELDMARLESVLDAAEAEEDRSTALDLLLARLIDLALDHRRMVSMLHGDPVMRRLVDEHEPFRRLMDRLYRLLAGDDPTGDGRIPAAMLSAAISGAMLHPFLADVDDDTLRAKLLDLARRFLDLPA
ncbi:MAG TPA: helix-turn-helix domain-containing protein [Acidimicrobiales bacterium]|nr:helix-turn-helix domain-containing protein [Acidimicrobiales bacterium]